MMLPYLIFAPFATCYLIMGLGLRYNAKRSALFIVPLLIATMVIEGLIFGYLDVRNRNLLVFSIVVYLPLALLMIPLGRKKGVSYLTACFNLFLPIYLVSITSNIVFEISHHIQALKFVVIAAGSLAAGLFVYFFYKRLHDLIEKILPKCFWMLFVYGIVMIAAIYIFDQFTDSEAQKALFGFAILFVYTVSIIFIYIILKSYNNTYQENQDLMLMKGQVQAIQDQYKMREIKDQEVKILRHDMKHILLNLHQLIQEDKKDEAFDFINNYINVIDATKTKTYCKEPIINSILDYYTNKALNDDVTLNMTVVGIDDALTMPPFEISVLISNCLDNAIKAAAKLKYNRMVDFKFINNDGRLVLQCKNNYDGILLIDKDGRPTNLAKGHGLGSDSIELFAKKNNLTINYDISENIYKITILF